MSEKVYNFKVEMSCEGCSNAVSKVLTKHQGQGVSNFNIDLPGQQVKVSTSSLSPEQVLEIVKKTGKNATFLSEEV